MANNPTFNIGSATASNLSTVVTDVTIPTLQQDNALNQDETIWQNNEWTQQWGYFNDVPEFHAAMIMKYSQIKNGKTESWKPEEIFHLSHKKLADQIHGISDSTSIKNTFLAEYESFADTKKIMHRQARPLVIFKLKTDDQTKVTAFIAKMDAAWNKGECIYIPDDENMLTYEIVQVDVSNTIMAWRTDINNKFYRAVGLPQILFGSAGSTESGGKMEYLAHETVFEHEQRYLEKQIWNQLNLKIDLVPPTSLLPNLQADENKDAAQGMEMQPNDMMAGSGE